MDSAHTSACPERSRGACPEQSEGAGRLIAFCGIDGSGKTTQVRAAVERTSALGRQVQEVSFPRYGQGFFAEMVQRYLRGDFGQNAADVSPYLAALPYALDRWQAAPQIREWLQAGEVVICNRYVAANMAHQGAKLPPAERPAFFRWVEEMEYGALALPRPDVQVLLDMPPALAARLTSGRGDRGGLGAGQDLHERDDSHLAATAEAYRQLAVLDPAHWAVIACSVGDRVLPPDEIAEHVWAALHSIL